jgi:hypothetical protein
MSTSAEYLPGQEPAAPTTGTTGGWFRAMRTPDAWELSIAAPNAFRLAWIIAYRGQYRDGFNRHNLALGESLLGDFKNCGMSERQYRTAKEQLAKWHFATFKTTNKGTVGKLTDTRLFSIFRLESDGQKDTRASGSRQASVGQPSDSRRLPRTKEGKEHKEQKNERGASRFSKTERIDPSK